MDATGGHILSGFNADMKELRDSLLSMGRLTCDQVENSVKGTLQRQVEACNTVIAEDDGVDEFENVIDRLGMCRKSGFALDYSSSPRSYLSRVLGAFPESK